jgi:micrococcal nuclease
VLVVFLLLRLAYDRWWSDRVSGPREALGEGRYRLVCVVDGDTLIVREDSAMAAEDRTSRPVRVRLLGIDCPEVAHAGRGAEPWGPEATAFTERFLSGRALRLRFDKRRIDPYGRYLAYVFVDEELLNRALVEAGLARVLTYPGDSLSIARRLRQAEQEARDHGRGIWSK